MKYRWLSKIEWQKELQGDYRMIAQLVGIDNFIALMETFEKTPVYFSTSPFERLLEKYIFLAEDISVKDLARETGKSERSIRRIRNSALSRSK
jgi:hypothetical protein